MVGFSLAWKSSVEPVRIFFSPVRDSVVLIGTYWTIAPWSVDVAYWMLAADVVPARLQRK